MAWFRRIGLFLAVNILVVLTISVILNVLGVRPYLTQRGLNYESLMVFCLVWGMGGALISLALSRVMAKMMMGVQVIDPHTAVGQARQLVDTVHGLARQAGLRVMPEVGIYESPDLNAFATGPTKSRSLVAVSSGLLSRMSSDEVRGVLGHEISHIANGDMVTMTLLQGVVNAFVMFLSRVIAYALTASRGSDREERGPTMSFYLVQILLEIVFMILGSMVVAWFSRYREFRADAGGARLAGRGSMIHALQALKRNFEGGPIVEEAASIKSLQISSRPGGMLRLFASHPPLDERIARLNQIS